MRPARPCWARARRPRPIHVPPALVRQAARRIEEVVSVLEPDDLRRAAEGAVAEAVRDWTQEPAVPRRTGHLR